MAISAITITQDNHENGSDLLAVHSPLVFIATAIHDNTPAPDYVHVLVYQHTDFEGTKVLKDVFRTILKDDNSTTERNFMFVADGILRGYMEGFEDFTQLSDTIQYCEGFTQIFTIIFEDPDNPSNVAETTFTALHGSGQFLEGCNKKEIYDNDIDTFIGVPNTPAMVYFYNIDTDAELTFTVTQV